MYYQQQTHQTNADLFISFTLTNIKTTVTMHTINISRMNNINFSYGISNLPSWDILIFSLITICNSKKQFKLVPVKSHTNIHSKEQSTSPYTGMYSDNENMDVSDNNSSSMKKINRFT